MPGKGANNRQHAMARTAARLRAQGRTTRQIAEAIGKEPERVKALVLLGERLQSESNPPPKEVASAT